jgi:hypothetical protein
MSLLKFAPASQRNMPTVVAVPAIAHESPPAATALHSIS